MRFASKNRGFTLIELLVVVAIIALLSSVIFATITANREKARLAAAMQFDATVAGELGDRLVASWTFDSPANPWADGSGQRHNGTTTGPLSLTPGYNGNNGVLFNSANQYTINLGVGTDYLPLKTFSACAWVKTQGPGASTQNGVLSLTYGIILAMDANGRFYTEADSTGAESILVAPGNLYDNKFHLLCLVYDGTNRIMYVDGVRKISDTPGWTGMPPAGQQTSGVVIGNNINGGTYYYNGIIDDVRIYGGAMTEAMIKKSYDLGPRFATARGSRKTL